MTQNIFRTHILFLTNIFVWITIFWNQISFDQLFFLGSMLPHYMAMSVLFVSFVSSKKICVSVRWVTLGVCPPTCENMYVHWLGYIMGASPLCVCVQLVILWVQRPPCVCPLEDNLCWILACCLLRFGAFFNSYFNLQTTLFIIRIFLKNWDHTILLIPLQTKISTRLVSLVMDLERLWFRLGYFPCKEIPPSMQKKLS